MKRFWEEVFESIQPFGIAISGTLSNLADATCQGNQENDGCN